MDTSPALRVSNLAKDFGGLKAVDQILFEVEEGELGIRSGRGFYEWTPESGEDLRARVAKALIEIGKWDQ
ncbi:hypothetical protein CMK14_20030 [Candidatus Poribacteria bacterium]|nr:hypothetical protein [Candidatus Poribacteria bacterium]